MTPLPKSEREHVPLFPIKTPGKIEGKTMFLSRKNAAIVAGGVILAVTFCQWGGSAAAQSGPTATPIPQVVATQQAANTEQGKVNELQAERAEVERRLKEINANIENQIAQAERDIAAAKVAAATQNAVEQGVIIGRIEGTIGQLRDSYAGKDAIISDLQARIEQQAAQSAEDRRTIDRTGLELRQAQQDKQNVLNAYNAVKAQQASNAQNDMVSNAILTVAVIALICIILTVIAFVISRRAAPDAPDAPAPIEGEYTVSDDNA